MSPSYASAYEAAPGSLPLVREDDAVGIAAWHSLAWLVFANAVGVLLAALLLVPKLNLLLTPWTYGRWMPVHMNAQLYGWCSLPLVAFLLRVYRTDRSATASWQRAALWIWSAALGAGAIEWLTGHSSGKLFLDWTGYTRVLFPLALLALWTLLATAFSNGTTQRSRSATLAQAAGLVFLLAVPVLLYIAADPGLYPPINPDSGGPTGASQLESTLVIVAILLLLPFGLARRGANSTRRLALCWAVFAVEALLCLGLGRADISHHRPTQYISLASLLAWLPLMPLYYAGFGWNENTHRWRIAFLTWWSILVPTGYALFLPGVLDRFKFTDGLVGHSFVAMAGFVSSLLIFALVQMLGEDGWIFTRARSFYLWHGSVLAYATLMFAAGWREGADPAFNMLPGTARNTIYVLRLALGVLILAASADWLNDANHMLRERRALQVTR